MSPDPSGSGSTENIDIYDLENALKTAFNTAVVELLHIEKKDYYAGLSTAQILTLKAALSDINNIITLRLAFSLADWICEKFSLVGEVRLSLLNEIRSVKPNANGFDIELSFPDIVAEIKCNIPVNGGVVYGAAQRNATAC